MVQLTSSRTWVELTSSPIRDHPLGGDGPGTSNNPKGARCLLQYLSRLNRKSRPPGPS